MNENYRHPEMPKGVEEGIIKGIYQLEKGKSKKKLRVQLMGSGTILREVEAAADILRNDFNVEADVWSVTSVNELAREGQECHRYNMMHPEDDKQVPYLTQQLVDAKGPVVAATDYIKMHFEQLRDFIPSSLTVLGTDGFGRSDSREQLRRFFEVNRYYVVVAALRALVDEGSVKASVVTKAIERFGLDADKVNPMSV
jgi:pyruvate dehydrogenase E1 component